MDGLRNRDSLAPTNALHFDTFISHRVARIQDTLPDSSWCHVASADNPADLASSDTTAMKLTESDLWWHGPPWLRLSESQWPPSGVGSPPRELPGTKMVMLTAITAPASVWNFWTRHSSFSTLLRTLAWMKCFISNCKKSVQQSHSRLLGTL